MPTHPRVEEFSRLYDEFLYTYPQSAAGQRAIALSAQQREQAARSYRQISEAAAAGQDVTDAVLRQLLPHADLPANRARGAWIHTAPAVTNDIRKWHESIGWTQPEEWPQKAAAILDFVRRCVEHPEELPQACAEFGQLPYSTGLQSGTLSPILNALRPAHYMVINGKSLRVLNFFTGSTYSQQLEDYPAANASGQALFQDLRDLLVPPQALDLRAVDLFDLFCHWLVTVKAYDFPTPRYWKLALGRGSRQWDAWQEGGFAAIGWDELGDITDLSRTDFDRLRDELVERYDDWTKSGANQVWKFAHHIQPGDRIVVNSGTNAVLGVGTISGAYYFVPDVYLGHCRPVKWDDLNRRRVNERTWRRTLMELEQETFQAIVQAPIIEAAPGPARLAESSTPYSSASEADTASAPFSPEALDLLARLSQEPTRDFYNAHRTAFNEKVQEPFQNFLGQVARKLPQALTAVLETEKRLFSRIPKNDFGRGGAWPFYWGAFYPKGNKRSQGPQLSLWMDASYFKYGFSIGKYGDEARQRFQRNCQKEQDRLVDLLGDAFDDEDFVYGSPETFTVTEKGQVRSQAAQSWQEFLADPSAAGYEVSVVLTGQELLACAASELSDRIAADFSRLFPLVLLAIEEDPIPAIINYLDAGGEQQAIPATEPVYSLAQCAEETGIGQEQLAQWIGAIERKGQAIFYGPPGTGKTFIAQQLAQHLVGGGDGFWDLVQFHPAYAYEDFIQGIRPVPQSDGSFTYRLVPGRFLAFCQEAETRSGRCVLVIDEINRTDLARVFGELMYLLEYRERTVPLSAGNQLRIPPNVRIIGTMNTADRSIALVDHALRRRFAFLALYPDYDVLRRYHQRRETGFPVEGLIQTLQRLNAQIGDPHYQMGISYFLQPDLATNIGDIWRMEIEPYLEEYFFDQPEQVDAFRWSNVREEITQPRSSNAARDKDTPE